jgi:hypothetical protein
MEQLAAKMSAKKLQRLKKVSHTHPQSLYIKANGRSDRDDRKRSTDSSDLDRDLDRIRLRDYGLLWRSGGLYVLWHVCLRLAGHTEGGESWVPTTYGRHKREGRTRTDHLPNAMTEGTHGIRAGMETRREVTGFRCAVCGWSYLITLYKGIVSRLTSLTPWFLVYFSLVY